MKRRSVVLGIGTLALGSGATFTSAALQNAATTNNSNLEVFSVGELLVERGEDTNPGNGKASGVDYTSEVSVSNAGDLPDAFVEGNTQNGSLEIDAAVRNNASSITFEELLVVKNQGTVEANVGFGFSSFGGTVTGGSISKDDVIDAYDFKVSSGGANISPTSSTTDPTTPPNFKTVQPGSEFRVDLKIDLSVGSLISDINTERDGDVNPSFDGNGVGDSVTLIDEITVGTENTST